MRDPATAECSNLVFGRGGARFQPDPRTQLLAIPFIRDTEHLGVGDGGMSEGPAINTSPPTARGRARGQYPRSAVQAHPKLTSALPTVEPEMRHSIGTSPGVGIF